MRYRLCEWKDCGESCGTPIEWYGWSPLYKLIVDFATEGTTKEYIPLCKKHEKELLKRAMELKDGQME